VPSINARLKEEADRWWDDVKSTFKEPGEVV
jgi:hypothetical protein